MKLTYNGLIKIIKKKIKNYLSLRLSTSQFFSQGGEDAILKGIFYKKMKRGEKGFYVDVGAYHPYKYSNTHLFYLNGWKGINIDANPGSMKEFNKQRKRDINLELGISDVNGLSTFYVLDEESTMNSFSTKNLQNHNMLKTVKKEVKIKTETLENVFDRYSECFKEIDFLTIDVEGMDQKVLESNNWAKYKPKVVVVELECSDIEDVRKHESNLYLQGLNYKIVAKNLLRKNLASVFFVLKDYEY